MSKILQILLTVFHFLCLTLAGCYFLEGAPPSPIIDRDLLANVNCPQRACWENWIVGETTLQELQASNRFNAPVSDYGEGRLALYGLENDRDIGAVIDEQTGTLLMLTFRGSYLLTLREILDTFGVPTYFEGDYRVTHVVNPPVVGDVTLYYPTRGYVFRVGATAEAQRSAGLVRLCPTEADRVERMFIFAPMSTGLPVHLIYRNNSLEALQAIQARLRTDFTISCFDIPGRF